MYVILHNFKHVLMPSITSICDTSIPSPKTTIDYHTNASQLHQWRIMQFWPIIAKKVAEHNGKLSFVQVHDNYVPNCNTRTRKGWRWFAFMYFFEGMIYLVSIRLLRIIPCYETNTGYMMSKSLPMNPERLDIT